MASIVFNWCYLAVVTSTGQIAMSFMEDLKRDLLLKEHVFHWLYEFCLYVVLGIVYLPHLQNVG
jgi:hypothetical protein